MMRDVIMRDLCTDLSSTAVKRGTVSTYVVEEETADPAQYRSVNGGNDTAKEGPFWFAIVRYRRIGVVQKRAHHYGYS
jgi:hypothetical protein